MPRAYRNIFVKINFQNTCLSGFQHIRRERQITGYEIRNVIKICLIVLGMCTGRVTYRHAFLQCATTVVTAEEAVVVRASRLGWTVRGSNPGERKISRTRPDGSRSPPTLLWRFSFPRLKRSGRGVDHFPPYIAEVKERVELYNSTISLTVLPHWAFMSD